MILLQPMLMYSAVTATILQQYQYRLKQVEIDQKVECEINQRARDGTVKFARECEGSMAFCKNCLKEATAGAINPASYFKYERDNR